MLNFDDGHQQFNPGLNPVSANRGFNTRVKNFDEYAPCIQMGERPNRYYFVYRLLLSGLNMEGSASCYELAINDKRNALDCAPYVQNVQ